MARPWRMATSRARIAARDADPARRAGVRRARSPASCSATGSSAAASRASGRRRCSSAKDNKILEDMETVPWLVSLLPTLMMLGGFAVAYYMYVVDKTAPARARRGPIRCSTASCSTSGISTNSTISCSCGRPSGSAACSGRAATASSSTASGPTASRRACSTSRATSCGCRPATSITTPSRCCIGVAALATWYLFGGVALMSGNWILSALLILPAGRRAADPAAARRERSDARTTRAGSRCGRR